VLLSKKYSVPIPSCIDDEYLSDVGQGMQPPGRPSRLVFFVQSLALFDLLFEILQTFYSAGESEAENKGEDLEVSDHFLQLSSKLDNFVSRLPDHLKEGHESTIFDEETASCFQMQANIIKSRLVGYSRN
jgi:hypothetical protein